MERINFQRNRLSIPIRKAVAHVDAAVARREQTLRGNGCHDDDMVDRVCGEACRAFDALRETPVANIFDLAAKVSVAQSVFGDDDLDGQDTPWMIRDLQRLAEAGR